MAASGVQDEAFVTLATNDSYAYGALVLGNSLRAVSTNRQLAILVTPSVSSRMRQLLVDVFDSITQVNPLDSHDEANLALLTRPELGITFSKLHCWRLTQYNKCVFMDADTLVLQNIDDLFEREELSASADVGWPDCFNSGVFVFRPSEETYRGLLQCAVTQGSFDGGDQGLLNTYFSDWSTKDISRHLPFLYNMTSSKAYGYLPAFVKFGSNVKVVHFIGSVKPWQCTYDTSSGTVLPHEGMESHHQLPFLQAWWDVFVDKVKPKLDASQEDLGTISSDMGKLKLRSAPYTPPSGAADGREAGGVVDSRTRQWQWEQGQIDYLGQDRFENIKKKLDEKINSV